MVDGFVTQLRALAQSVECVRGRGGIACDGEDAAMMVPPACDMIETVGIGSHRNLGSAS